jgi:rare lipoprotein A
MTRALVVRAWTAVAIAALLAGCASKPATKTASNAPRPGVFYKDDGPPNAATTPSDLDQIPDALPRDEPLHRFANRPYNVFGVDYKPLNSVTTLRQRGVASWYGRKFHGQKTAIGEVYDMFAMTAAHPTAPLPSFARVTNTRSGKGVIVRINDRGPFLAGRIVDLSYAAAHRIGIAQAGSGEVEFELLLPPFASYASAASVATSASSASAAPRRPEPPAPVAAQEQSPLPTPTTQSGQTMYFVQLGAFGNFANAQVFQQHMGTELSVLPRIQQIDSLFRVRLGPYATRDEAIVARDRAQSVLSTHLPITVGTSSP